jgi:hypothetical protein
MKFLLPCALLSSATLVLAQDTYITSIIQTNYYSKDGVVQEPTDITIADLEPSGTTTSPDVVLGRGVFQLVAENVETGDLTILDTETVETYKIDSSIGITPDSDDLDYHSKPGALLRTQVNYPINLSYNISGLVAKTHDEATEQNSSLILTREVYSQKYNPNAPALTIDFEYTENGEYEDPTLEPYLNSKDFAHIDPSYYHGKEVFSVNLKPDNSINAPASELDSVTIYTLPVPEAEYASIDFTPGAEISRVGTVEVAFSDLYVDDEVFLYLSGGELEEPLLEQSYLYSEVGNDADKMTTDGSLVATDIDEKLSEHPDGDYSLEVVFESAYSTRKPGSYGFTLRRGITINANNITTSE